MLDAMPEAADAERTLELAEEAVGRFDVAAAIAHLSAAIRQFTAAGLPCRAAMACVRLGDLYANALGNLTTGRAWFARASRIVADQPPCVEQGWVAVASLGCDVDDPAELLALAELALDRARTFGDVNLETKALADAGLARVQAGHLTEGMAQLDEAMALACGPADDAGVAAKSVCSFFTACYYAGDFERAGAWAVLLREHGLIGAAPPGPAFVSSHCDSVQATFLVELGRWSEAEALLSRAKADFEAAMKVPWSWHPDIALADLRVLQGRCAEAEALLLGKDQAMQALLPAARLHLARGDYDLARATATRGLRAVRGDRLRAVELLGILVDVELAAGALDTAAIHATDLATRARGLEATAVLVRAAVAQARVGAAAGDLVAAVTTLEATLGVLDSLDERGGDQLPWRRALLLVELARLRDRTGDAAGAGVDAKAASAALAALDVTVAPLDEALLARLSPPSQSRGATPSTAVLARDGRSWVASYAGVSSRLADTKGLRYLAELVARPGAERHVLDLVDQVEGVAGPGGVDRHTLGDAGTVLDARARAAYRRRIEELRADADDCLAAGRYEAAEAAQDELDQLVGQLAQAFGLGGRDRRAASAAERARLNVTRALRAAIAKLVAAVPGAGEVLDRRVRTGRYCAYTPSDSDGVHWIVQS